MPLFTLIKVFTVRRPMHKSTRLTSAGRDAPTLGNEFNLGETAMKTLRILTLIPLGLMLFVAQAWSQPAAPAPARNVVLVHGAWADGSSWSEVIARLQAAGLQVTAVQNPRPSLGDSVAATRRILALQDGPIVLVAHSWGGAGISETGTDPKVPALVYV